MKYRPRIYYTESQKALMWDRWQKGDSLQSIARLFDRSHSSIAGILARTGEYVHRREDAQDWRWRCQNVKRYPEALRGIYRSAASLPRWVDRHRQ